MNKSLILVILILVILLVLLIDYFLKKRKKSTDLKPADNKKRNFFYSKGVLRIHLLIISLGLITGSIVNSFNYNYRINSKINFYLKDIEKKIEIDRTEMKKQLIFNLKEDLTRTHLLMKKMSLGPLHWLEKYNADVLIDSTLLKNSKVITDQYKNFSGIEEKISVLIQNYNMEIRNIFIDIDDYQDEALTFMADYMFDTEISDLYKNIITSIEEILIDYEGSYNNNIYNKILFFEKKQDSLQSFISEINAGTFPKFIDDHRKKVVKEEMYKILLPFSLYLFTFFILLPFLLTSYMWISDGFKKS